MADVVEGDASKRAFSFIRGAESDVMECEWPDGADRVRQALGESLNARNVAFLLGAGCSSSWKDDQEVGVPTMAPLAAEFTKEGEVDDPAFPTTAERGLLLKQFGIDIGAEDHSRNLERLMELLYCLRFALRRSSLEEAEAQLTVINSMIDEVRKFLWTKCTGGAFANGDDTVMALYEALFRTAKALLHTRPIYHSSDAAIRGHVFCSFLGLILCKELQNRCEAAGIKPEWGDVLRDLDRLQEATVTRDGKSMILRTPAEGCVGKLFKAVGDALPPNVRDIAA